MDTTEPKLVYVVDDEPSVRRALGRLLRSLGYRSREFASGHGLLTRGRFDTAACFVIDINMPQMNGYELSRRLEKAAPNTPIILITAGVEEQERWREEKTAAVGLLLKPLSERQLTTALKEALE